MELWNHHLFTHTRVSSVYGYSGCERAQGYQEPFQRQERLSGNIENEVGPWRNRR